MEKSAPTHFMLIQKGNREDAIRALINTWLKDPARYCANCDKPYVQDDFLISPCCERPLINTNVEITKVFLKEVKEIRETRKNDFASNEDKTMRWGLSMPSRLYRFLDKTFNELYQEKLISKAYPLTWFAKKFPQFTIPQKV